jgi:hypothetical protein
MHCLQEYFVRHSESFEMNARRDNGIVRTIDGVLVFDLDSTGFDDTLNIGERVANFDQKMGRDVVHGVVSCGGLVFRRD